MKLLIVIIKKEDTERVREVLLDAGISHTHVATTGGFRRMGNTTLMIGVEECMVNGILHTIRKALYPVDEKAGICDAPMKDQDNKAVVFIIDVVEHVKL